MELNIGENKRQNILKGFEDDIEKSRSGVYANTPENKKLNRVGQKYGAEKKEDEPSEKKAERKPEVDENGKKKPITKTLEEHAATTDTETLKKVLETKGAKEELVSAAKKELEKRGVSMDKKSSMGMTKEEHAGHVKSFNEAIEKLSGVDTPEAKESAKSLTDQRNAHEKASSEFDEKPEEKKPEEKKKPEAKKPAAEVPKIGKIKSYKINGKTFEVDGHEGEGILLVDGGRKSLNFLKENGAEFSEKSSKEKEPTYVLKNYKKDLKDAVSSMQKDLDEVDTSELYDVAESLSYDEGIKSYLSSKGYNTKRSLIQKIQDDMEMMLD